MAKRIKTNYPGVYYREENRIGGPGKEKVYYVRFYKDDRPFEEKVGRQYSDAMTPTRAALYRSERMEGKRKSRKEIRLEQEEASREKANRWTISRIWEEYKRTKSIKGIVSDDNRFNNHLKEKFGDLEPMDLTPSHFDRLRVDLTQRQYSPSTVCQMLELLRRIVYFADKKQLCEIPRLRIEFPRVSNQKTEDLSPDQLARLIQVFDKYPCRPVACMMKLALFTGMRKGEIIKLRWTDLDFKRKFINMSDPKGGSDQRIPMNQTAEEILTRQPKVGKYVFPGNQGKRRVDVSKEANSIKEEAGLPKDFRPFHGLRHVFASTLASSGQVDLYTLQRLLTHKSPNMTQRYAHLRDDALRRASNVMEEMIQVDTQVGSLLEITAG
ncbi:MAG: tyrosine-type recombinase/integrase [Deltaproteobacteria bacterium]|nr:tyrosine-type recombinase/integrase [Deltaproteobacteria bacterium]